MLQWTGNVLMVKLSFSKGQIPVPESEMLVLCKTHQASHLLHCIVLYTKIDIISIYFIISLQNSVININKYFIPHNTF